MCNTEYNRKQVLKYLIWTFLIAYFIQIGVALLYKNGKASAGQLVMAAMMFVPTLGVLLSGAAFKGMGWNPRFRKNIWRILASWFVPLILTAAGATLHFLIFPGHLDLIGSARHNADERNGVFVKVKFLVHVYGDGQRFYDLF